MVFVMQPVRPTKESAIKAAICLAPEYADLLRDFQRGNGRVGFPVTVAAIQNQCGFYVTFYEAEHKIGKALCLGLMGIGGYKEFEERMALASQEEGQAYLDEMANLDEESVNQMLSNFRMARTPVENDEIKKYLSSLPEDERRKSEQRGIFLSMAMFSNFFNTLSLMIHGAKLTSLVPQAMNGDDAAFLKAAQIDRMLLLHHPFFKERKMRAQSEGETKFLGQLAYRESNPTIQGKIRYPALYMLFGILDAYRWLNDLRHEEILDICDEAGLDRYQNRIEDVNYLTKRLGEYRRWQETTNMSMQLNKNGSPPALPGDSKGLTE